MRRLFVSIILLFLPLVTTEASRKTQRRIVPKQLTELFFAELCSAGCSVEEKARWKENFRWELHDLNTDSRPEYFLYIDHADWCGAGGSNCTYWVYQKTSGGYKLLLDAPRARPLNRIPNGYRDVSSDFRTGASSSRPGKFEYNRKTFKFDGRKYREHSDRVVYKNG
jgi:hypothetical protein